MTNVSWKDQKTNEYELYLVKEKRKLLNTVLKFKKRYGHLERRESFKRIN